MCKVQLIKPTIHALEYIHNTCTKCLKFVCKCITFMCKCVTVVHTVDHFKSTTLTTVKTP